MARQKKMMEGFERIRMLDEDDQRLMEGRHVPADLGFINVSYVVGEYSISSLALSFHFSLALK
jgi:hypothetical protein